MAPSQTGGVPIGGIRSQTERSCTLRIFGGGDELQIPVKISTRVLIVRELLAQKVGVHPDTLQFVAKSGPYTRQLVDTDEVRSQVWVKGISSFQRQKKQYPHPHAIIGAGHNGLRQALAFAEEKNANYVLFDRRDRVGGTSWLAHANKWSKVQTEFGTYHLNYSEQCGCPTGSSVWPSRDELLAHFDQVCDEWGLRANFRLSTDVLRYDALRDSAGEPCFSLATRQAGPGGRGAEEATTVVSTIALFPGNLTNPRRETYKGEEAFCGPITYGMFDETDYGCLAGKTVAIVGFGAFAVENIRTCCEHRAKKIYLVCRRKNLCMPRIVSWWINGSLYPVCAGDMLRAMEDVYRWVGDDPWRYYAVQSNADRTNVTIFQTARFGIGDIYFLSRYYGKTDVVEGTIKKLSKETLHLESGAKLENVQALLKLLGFVGEWSVDKFLQLKELVGLWVNDDFRRATVSEFPTIHSQRFGGTSLSPAALISSHTFLYFYNYPSDFAELQACGTLPRHRPDVQKDAPGYVLDAKTGNTCMVVISSACAGLALQLARTGGAFKRSKQWGTHSLEEVQREAEQDWLRYCELFREDGDDRPFPPYPFPLERVREMVATQDAEELERLQRRFG